MRIPTPRSRRGFGGPREFRAEAERPSGILGEPHASFDLVVRKVACELAKLAGRGGAVRTMFTSTV